MKIIPLGLQCSVPDAIKQANKREYSYPFDWLWTPSKTTYNILNILMNEGVEKAVKYMTTDYTYYTYSNINKHYTSINIITENQMNSITGLGITHFTINDDYKSKLKIRLERLLRDIKSDENILFIYADAANCNFNYHLDNIEYRLDATEYLLKIYDLIRVFNSNIEIVYFCWNKRKKENDIIKYVAFDFKQNWHEVRAIIKNYLIKKLKINIKYIYISLYLYINGVNITNSCPLKPKHKCDFRLPL